jgi:hypothetical protein
MENKIPIDKLMQTLSEILSDKHGAKITLRAIPKESAESAEKKAG